MKATPLFATAALVLATGAALAQSPATTAAAPAASAGLSRSEVLADLALWRRAGMDTFSDLEGADPNSADATRRLAAYQQMRHGTAYAIEVQHFAQQRGEAVGTTAAGVPVTPAPR